MQRVFRENAIELAVVSEANATIGQPVIYLGQTEFAKQNGINFAAMPGVLSNYGHYHHTVIDPKVDGEKHPEYFILASGRRDNRSPHLCNLYVRVEAELKAELMDSFNARGRDEELWLQECINLLLAPSGYSSQYYYLTYEPVVNSFIDSNHGFIADSLHPKFGWNDQTWDGDWTYVNALKPAENHWVSLVTIPFTTLETPAPRSGTVWAANVGRVHYREKIKDSNHSAMVKNREVSVWTGKLNASFDPGEAFMGEMVFE